MHSDPPGNRMETRVMHRSGVHIPKATPVHPQRGSVRMRAVAWRRVSISLIGCVALTGTSLLAGTAIATTAVPTSEESKPRAEAQRARPGVLYTGSDIPLTVARNGATVTVTLPTNADLRATTAGGHTTPDIMGSLVRNWSALGMQRKGASFWVRPAGARSVVRLGSPMIRDGAVMATASAATWNAAVPAALRLTPARTGARSRGAATPTETTATIAAQSTTPVPVCPISSYNWTGVCVLDGTSVAAALSFTLPTGLSATATTCWEVTTPGATPASFQASSFWSPGMATSLNGELRAQSSGQCLANETMWTPILMPTSTVDTSGVSGSIPGVANSTYFSFTLRVEPPAPLPLGVQKLYMSIITDPPNAGGATSTIVMMGT